MNFKDIPIEVEVGLGLLGIPITPDVQRMLDVAKEHNLEPTLAVVLVVTLVKGVKSFAGRSIDALESIAKELKNIGVEAELTREALTETTKAIYNHTSESCGHVVR